MLGLVLAVSATTLISYCIIPDKILYVLLNTDASDWDTSTTSKASKNLPVYKPEDELASETLTPPPVLQEQQLCPSVTEAQGASNIKKEGENESSVLGTRPLPSPRSFKPFSSTQPQPQPQTRINKEPIKKPVSDEGKAFLCKLDIQRCWNDQST